MEYSVCMLKVSLPMIVVVTAQQLLVNIAEVFFVSTKLDFRVQTNTSFPRNLGSFPPFFSRKVPTLTPSLFQFGHLEKMCV